MSNSRFTRRKFLKHSAIVMSLPTFAGLLSACSDSAGNNIENNDQTPGPEGSQNIDQNVAALQAGETSLFNAKTELAQGANIIMGLGVAASIALPVRPGLARLTGQLSWPNYLALHEKEFVDCQQQLIKVQAAMRLFNYKFSKRPRLWKNMGNGQGSVASSHRTNTFISCKSRREID